MLPDRPVLGCDTIVVVDGVALGKPTDDADAARMLRLLAGRAHDVTYGDHPPDSGRRRAWSRTRVYFSAMSEREIAEYIATGEARDKASSLWHSKALPHDLRERIEGCYYNVMGLPVAALYQRLLKN